MFCFLSKINFIMIQVIETTIITVPAIKILSAFNQCIIFIMAPITLTMNPSSNKTKGHLKKYNEFFIAELMQG